MLKSRPTGCVILMIWIYFNGVIAQENITLVMVTVASNGILTTDARYESTKKAITKIMGEVTTSLSTDKKTNYTGTLGITSTAADHSNNWIPEKVTREKTSISTSQPLKPTYLAATQKRVTTTYHSGASDDNIYILIGAACTGFLALILFIVLLIFIFKRCQKNDYTKADTELHDDEKGDISGPRWVFNDDRQDWLYDGADDDEDNQYVGPLAGKTGKRTSLMDKRYTHDSETFGRASPPQPPKRPPIPGTGSNLERVTHGDGEAEENKMTDDIGLVEISNVNMNINEDETITSTNLP